ncbi:hypothetical protein T4C_5881 [Trichinella pseudospiralis]|uniref:Uncharacterized protein n=1 Tax=Trichinella pseudospiralis TaxID=6337 RepID=A0A0V1G7Y6_TRIPS|nr:hypothetical protein T4C_5881 [Trichinella pseudospiralis]
MALSLALATNLILNSVNHCLFLLPFSLPGNDS